MRPAGFVTASIRIMMLKPSPRSLLRCGYRYHCSPLDSHSYTCHLQYKFRHAPNDCGFLWILPHEEKSMNCSFMFWIKVGINTCTSHPQQPTVKHTKTNRKIKHIFIPLTGNKKIGNVKQIRREQNLLTGYSMATFLEWWMPSRLDALWTPFLQVYVPHLFHSCTNQRPII